MDWPILRSEQSSKLRALGSSRWRFFNHGEVSVPGWASILLCSYCWINLRDDQQLEHPIHIPAGNYFGLNCSTFDIEPKYWKCRLLAMGECILDSCWINLRFIRFVDKHFGWLSRNFLLADKLLQHHNQCCQRSKLCFNQALCRCGSNEWKLRILVQYIINWKQKFILRFQPLRFDKLRK